MNKPILILFGIICAATNLAAQMGANSVVFGGPGPVLGWDASPGASVAGYNVKYGVLNGNTTNCLDAQLNTQVMVPNLAVGAANFLYVTSYDSARNESIPSAVVLCFPLCDPSVALTSPPNGAHFTNITSLSILAPATANNTGATIAKVEFYNGASKLGETSGSGNFSWVSVPAGTFSIWAKATDTRSGAWACKSS